MQVEDDQKSMSAQVDKWLSEEDTDLGFGVSEGEIKPAAHAPLLDAPEVKADSNPVVPEWATDDESFPRSSFVEAKSVNRHDSLVQDIRRNLRAIHSEAKSIGIAA